MIIFFAAESVNISLSDFSDLNRRRKCIWAGERGMLICRGFITRKPADRQVLILVKVRRVEHNMPKIWYYGVFSLFHRCRASARLPSQKQKSIRTLCVFGAEQFKTRRFLFEQGTKSPPYCRMVRFLTQFRRKYAVLNHIGFDSPHLKQMSID